MCNEVDLIIRYKHINIFNIDFLLNEIIKVISLLRFGNLLNTGMTFLLLGMTLIVLFKRKLY